MNQLRYKLLLKKNVDSSRLPQQKTVVGIMSNKLTTSVSSGNMLKMKSCHWRHPMEMDRTKDKMGNLVPLLMGKNPAPQSLLELVVCRYKKGCNKRCSCRNVGLSCTATCNYGNEGSNDVQDDYNKDEGL